MEQNTNLPTTNENAVVKPDEVLDNTPATAPQVVMQYVKMESRQDKVQLLRALQSADEMVDKHRGETITIVGVYAETHFSQKKQAQVCRVLLISEDGKSYATGSFVFMNSLKQIIDVMGSPLDEPLAITIAERQMEKGTALIAQIAE